MEGALDVGVAGAQEGHDDLRRLLEPSDDVVLWQPERMGLTPRMTRAQTKDETAAADLVERLDRLRGDARVAVQGGQDPGTDLDPRRGGRNGPRHGDALPEPLRWSVGRPPQQLIGHPDRVETDLLGMTGDVPDLVPARRRTVDEDIPRGEHETDLE